MKPPKYFSRYQRLAGRFLSVAKLPALLWSVTRKRDGLGAGFAQMRGHLMSLQGLCVAWVKGEYREIGKPAMLSVVGALVYFVSPIDAIPDWLLGVGFVDDLAVLAWVMNAWSHELAAFERWRQAQPASELAQIEQLPYLEGAEVIERS